MEVGCAARESTQNRTLQSSDISPQSSDQSAARIGSRLDFVGDLVLQCNDRKITHVEEAIRIGNANVQRHRNSMIAHVRRIVTSPAGARNGRKVQIIIETGD